MKCLKCRSEMSECYQRDEPTELLKEGWICSTLGCERFGLFIEVKDDERLKKEKKDE